MSVDQISRQITFRAADAAVPDLLPGSGAAAVSTSTLDSEARFDPLDPGAVATAWLTALLVRRDWTTLWSTTDPNLRLAAAQRWLARIGSTGDNVTAWSLAAEVPHIGMWGPFADHQFSRWYRALAPTAPRPGDGAPAQSPTDRRQIRVATSSDVGRELCFVGADEAASTPVLTLRRRDRWRVAGIGAGVMQPGWPARWIALDASDGHVES